MQQQYFLIELTITQSSKMKDTDVLLRPFKLIVNWSNDIRIDDSYLLTENIEIFVF